MSGPERTKAAKEEADAGDASEAPKGGSDNAPFEPTAVKLRRRQPVRLFACQKRCFGRCRAAFRGRRVWAAVVDEDGH